MSPFCKYTAYGDFMHITRKMQTLQKLQYRVAYSENPNQFEREICSIWHAEFWRDTQKFRQTYPKTSAALDAECQRTRQGAYIFDLPIITNNGYGQKWCNATE